MIGKLKGNVDEIESNYILLETGSGVFHNVCLPGIILRKLTIGQPFVCYVHFHVRENEISLYGFPDKDYLHTFELLISIPNIGPKSALNIIGYNSLLKLIEAVNQQDQHYFAKIPGIGKKTSQKILLDLANKFDVEFKLQKQTFTQEEQTIVDALINLGFKKHEACQALEQVDDKLPLEEKLSMAIRSLNTHGKD